jgi:hypothetical protein
VVVDDDAAEFDPGVAVEPVTVVCHTDADPAVEMAEARGPKFVARLRAIEGLPWRGRLTVIIEGNEQLAFDGVS